MSEFVPLRLEGVRQPDVGKPLDRVAKGDLALQPRQRSAETEVDAMAEREVRIWSAPEIEVTGICKLARVAVGRVGEGEDALALRRAACRRTRYRP